MSTTKKAWINALFLAITLAVNTLGALGLINGLSQKQVSDMYPTLITPSPSTFGIWSIIYSLLLISVVVMIIKKRDSYYQKAVDRITLLFRISCVLNILWIIAFSYVQIALSSLLIFAFVVTLSFIDRRLATIQEGKRWLLPLTFGLYMGWLFIATVVNIAATLVKLRWNGFGLSDEVWAIVVLIVAVFLVIAVLLINRNAVFPLPVAWAYLGIYFNLNSQVGTKGQYGLLQIVALGGMVVLIAAAGIQLYRNVFSLLPNATNPNMESDHKANA